MDMEDKVDRIIEQNDRIILLLEMLVGLDSGDTFSIHGEYAQYWFKQAGID